MTLSPEYAAFAADFVAKRDAKIRPEWRLTAEEIDSARNSVTGVLPFVDSKLTPREVEITKWTGEQALKEMHKKEGRTSIVEVVTSVCHRAALTQQIINCFVVLLFEEAIQQAAALDAAFLSNSVPPNALLYGLPVTVKESFDLKGTTTSWGFVKWAMDGPRESDSSVVEILKANGGIIIAKTNVPMSLMAWEGHNNLVGRALNPHNTLLATGGSSSGEGAALGSFSSYLGAATDIAGSIRLPATVCGAYGLKPSGQRFPFSGSRVLAFGSPSESAVPPVHGPVARSVADLELYAKAFINPAFVKYDHNVLPIPWREVTLPQKLKIGYFVDNGACLPAPPVRRMMAESIEKLKAAGHELIPFTPVDVMGMFETCFAFFDAWYGDLFQVIGPNTGDPFISAIAPDLDPRAGLALTDPKVNLPMNKNWELYVKKQIALHIWTQQFLSLGLDAIVCPTAGVPAPPHEKSGEMTPLPISYTCAINLLDWTAGTIPALTVTQSDLTPYTEQPRSEKEAAVFKVYNENLDKYLNAKCGLQVIGRRLEEEKVLAVMKVVDAALKA